MKKKIILACFVTLLFMFMAGALVSNATVSVEGRAPFVDVNDGQWFNETVIDCFVNGIMKGTTSTVPGTFSPDTFLTREQFIMVLANFENADVSEYTETTFNDVIPDTWYANAVCWAEANGITNGMGVGYFGVGVEVTREQFCTLLVNYMVAAGYEITTDYEINFPDSDEVSEWAEESIRVVASKGLILGDASGKLLPKNNMTRAMAASVMSRYLRGIACADCEHVFTETSCTSSSMCSECGLINGMPFGHDCPVLTCVEGSLCTRCGVKVSADPAMHKYSEATCTVAQRCQYCDNTLGRPLGHDSTAATCETQAVCRRCGEITASALGHKYVEATCTQPKTCVRCYKTVGTAIAHSIGLGGVCTSCGVKIYDLYDEIIAAVKAKGTYSRGSYTYTEVESGADKNGMPSIMGDFNAGFTYDSNGDLWVVYSADYAYNDDVEFKIKLVDEIGVSYEFVYNVKNSSGYTVKSAQGYIMPSNYAISVTYSNGATKSNVDDYISGIRNCDFRKDMNGIIYYLCGGNRSLWYFGFGA